VSECQRIRRHGIVCKFSHPTHILTPYTNIYSHTLHTCRCTWFVTHTGLEPIAWAQLSDFGLLDCIFSHSPQQALVYSDTLHTCGWMCLVSHKGLIPGCQIVSVVVCMGSYVYSHTLHIFSHPEQIYILTPYTPADGCGSSVIKDASHLRLHSSAISCSCSWIVYSHTLHIFSNPTQIYIRTTYTPAVCTTQQCRTRALGLYILTLYTTSTCIF